MSDAAVIGAGPAGLMAAESLATAGLNVAVYETKPSVGRKFLMAGKSGLNLTKAEGHEPFLRAFAEARGPLQDCLRSFDADAVQIWAKVLGQETFIGSTGRVFPVAMKASPLLRAWMARLRDAGVVFRTRWNWTGWSDGGLQFDTSEGLQIVQPNVTVLALGGASWARLGSTGSWADILAEMGISLAPFAPSNAGVSVQWSAHMAQHYGSPLKGVTWTCGPYGSKGEAVISSRGLEGGGIYSVSRGVRETYDLKLDLLPNLDVPEVMSRLKKPRRKSSLSTHLRKALRLTPVQIALAQEMARPLPVKAEALAQILKALPINYGGLRPMDEAISTAGGVPFSALDQGLMLKDLPGVFVAGEMIDWEAPTGGYLISACLATGRWAGIHAAEWAARTTA